MATSDFRRLKAGSLRVGTRACALPSGYQAASSAHALVHSLKLSTFSLQPEVSGGNSLAPSSLQQPVATSDFRLEAEGWELACRD